MHIRTFCLAALAAFFLVISHSTAGTLAYRNHDTRSQGHYEVATIPISPDGNGSLRMRTFDGTSQGKVSVVFAGGASTPALGTLGELSSLSADFYKKAPGGPPSPFIVSALSVTPADPYQFAYRLWLDPAGTTALVWENNYNGNGHVTTNTWHDNFDLFTGKFWQRGNGNNFNGGAQAFTLDQWKSGTIALGTNGDGAPASSAYISENSLVYGLEVAFGSGISKFEGYVDDVRIGFTSDVYVGDVSAAPTPVPLPPAVWAGGALLVLACIKGKGLKLTAQC